MKRNDKLVELFRDQRAALWKFFLAAAGSADEAEDLLQETFMKLWEHRESLHDPDGARRWLWRVARNRMIDEIRVRQRQRARSGDAPAEIEDPDAPDPADEFRRGQARRLMREVASTLPGERARRCLALWLTDRSFADIAHETGLSRDQVRGLLQRAKKDVIRETLVRMGVDG